MESVALGYLGDDEVDAPDWTPMSNVDEAVADLETVRSRQSSVRHCPVLTREWEATVAICEQNVRCRILREYAAVGTYVDQSEECK